MNAPRCRYLPFLAIAVLTTLGCSAPSAPADRFAPDDLTTLQAICKQPPYPTSYSTLRHLATGHLKQVLDSHKYISAGEYRQWICVGDGESLQGRAALVVMERINGRDAAGIILLLFTPELGNDVFTFDAMLANKDVSGGPTTLRTHYSFDWHQPDQLPDYVADKLELIDPHARGELVGPDGQPNYDFRWGDP